MRAKCTHGWKQYKWAWHCACVRWCSLVRARVHFPRPYVSVCKVAERSVTCCGTHEKTTTCLTFCVTDIADFRIAKMYYRLAVVTLLALAASSTLAADITGGWVLGNAGVSSCDIVCGALARTCNVTSMKDLDSRNEFDNVNARLSNAISCSTYAATALKYAPSTNPSTLLCNYNGTLSGCGSPTGSMPSTVQRLCCCRTSGCLLTSPVRIDVCAPCHLVLLGCLQFSA
jgi:hypothetical protein